MSECEDGGPAFPCTASDLNNPAPGMSLRDWFAGTLLCGAFADPKSMWQGNSQREALAKAAAWSYLAADAMLAARKGGA